jgi:hypothetical protein
VEVTKHPVLKIKVFFPNLRLCRVIGRSLQLNQLAVYKPQRSPANEIPQTSAHHAPRWWLVALEQIASGFSPNYDLRGARNSPRAGPNHPRGVRSKYNRWLDSRRLPGGAAPPTCGKGGAGFGVQERVLNSTCGAIPRRSGP